MCVYSTQDIDTHTSPCPEYTHTLTLCVHVNLYCLSAHTMPRTQPQRQTRVFIGVQQRHTVDCYGNTSDVYIYAHACSVERNL